MQRAILGLLVLVLAVGCGRQRDAGPTPAASTPAPDASAALAQSTDATGDRVGDATTAARLVATYEGLAIAGDWPNAWALLAPWARPTLADFTDDEGLYFRSVKGRWSTGPPQHDLSVLRQWLFAENEPSRRIGGLGADLGRAYLVEVDYPAMAGNNAGWEMYLAAPDDSGTWRLWLIR